jgi:hypothetical protein
VSDKTAAYASPCGDENEVRLSGDAWVRYRCDLSEGHDGPHNDFLGLVQWDIAAKPDPKSSDAGSVLVSLLLAAAVLLGFIGLYLLGEKAMCVMHDSQIVYCADQDEVA